MKELNEITLNDVTGGGDLPINSSHFEPNVTYLAFILALLTPRPVVHLSD